MLPSLLFMIFHPKSISTTKDKAIKITTNNIFNAITFMKQELWEDENEENEEENEEENDEDEVLR